MKTGMGTSMSKAEIQQQLKQQWLPNWAKLADQSPTSPSPQDARLLNILDEQERRMPGSTKPQKIDKALFLDLPEGVTFEHPQARGSLVQRILHSPNIVIGVAATCVGLSAIFCGLGYWWVLAHTNGTAPTPYALMGVSDAPRHGQSAMDSVGHAAQSIFRMAPPEPEETDGNAMLAQSGEKSNSDMSLEDIKQDLKEPSGRTDPFSPLVQPMSTTGPDSMVPEKRDLLLDVQYTGFIGDANAKDKVAILKISDPAGGAKTVIKKIGESFLVEGEKAILKGISKDRVQLVLEGQTRWLDLHPYQEADPANNSGNASSGASSTGSASASGNATSGGVTNAASASGSASTNSSSGRFPNLSILQER